MMSIHEQREELRRKAENLNEVSAMVDRVEAHAKYLSTIPITERNHFQRLWVAAYEGVEWKMSLGTEDTFREAGLNLVALDNLRGVTTKEYVLTLEERPRFSFFGRRPR
jgi:hypothetical protein